MAPQPRLKTHNPMKGVIMAIKLWHCFASRSIRPLWALEEMGLDYEVVSMHFPPRFKEDGYTELNNLGTVPYLEDGPTKMTESSGMCHYLLERYQKWEFGLKPDHDEYGDYINWLYHSDATLTFPQAVYIKFVMLQNPPGLEAAGHSYVEWFNKRLVRLENHLENREYLVDNRFTIADIAIGYALHMATMFKLIGDEMPRSKAYYERLTHRPAFQKAATIGEGMESIEL